MKHSLDELVTAITLLFGPIPAKKIIGSVTKDTERQYTMMLDSAVAGYFAINDLHQIEDNTAVVSYAKSIAEHMEKNLQFSAYEADLFVRNFFALQGVETPTGYVEQYHMDALRAMYGRARYSSALAEQGALGNRVYHNIFVSSNAPIPPAPRDAPNALRAAGAQMARLTAQMLGASGLTKKDKSHE